MPDENSLVEQAQKNVFYSVKDAEELNKRVTNQKHVNFAGPDLFLADGEELKQLGAVDVDEQQEVVVAYTNLTKTIVRSSLSPSNKRKKKEQKPKVSPLSPMRRCHKKETKKVIAQRRSVRLTGKATTTVAALTNNSQQLSDSSEVFHHEDRSAGTDMDVE